jgi:hypothetical protein
MIYSETEIEETERAFEHSSLDYSDGPMVSMNCEIDCDFCSDKSKVEVEYPEQWTEEQMIDCHEKLFEHVVCCGCSSRDDLDGSIKEKGYTFLDDLPLIVNLSDLDL